MRYFSLTFIRNTKIESIKPELSADFTPTKHDNVTNWERKETKGKHNVRYKS